MDLEGARRLSSGRADDHYEADPPAQKLRVLALVFRYRYALHILVYTVGFAITWFRPKATGVQRVWLALPEAAASHLPISLQSAILALTVLATLLAFLGAFLRTWGTAHLGSGVVFDPQAHGGDLATSGPFQYLRNPLYLGTFLHTIALSLLMSWGGALFTIVTIGAMQMALIFSEERFLLAELGPAYEAYSMQVPRIFPTTHGLAKVETTKAHWPMACVSEIYMWGTAISFALFGSTYNALPILQGVLISFGLSIVVRAFTGGTKARSPG